MAEETVDYQELVGQIGGSSDPFRDWNERDEVLAVLVMKNVITLGDAETIRGLMSEDASPEDVLGMVAGEVGVAPRTLEQATQGTDVHVSAYEIDEQKRTFLQRLSQLGGTWVQGMRMGPGLVPSFAMEQAPEIVEAVTGWSRHGGIDPEKGILGAFIDSEEEAAAKGYRERVRNKIVKEIEDLQRTGDLSDTKADKLLGRIELTEDRFHSVGRGADFEQVMREVYDELSNVYDDMGDDIGGRLGRTEEIIRQASILQELRVAGKYKETPDTVGPSGETYVYGEGVMSPEESAAIPEGAAVFDPDTGFVGYMGAAGLDTGMTAEEIADKLQQMQSPYSTYESVFGHFTTITDPSSGQSFTPAEWQSILHPMDEADELLKLQYLRGKAEAGTPESIKEILSKPVFTADHRRGGTRIPVEDLAIRSPMPTEPWEVPAVEYRYGDGRAQWATFSSRQRRMRIDAMRHQGLINDEQYEIMRLSGGDDMLGAAIWENAVGYAMVTQKDPIHALGVMGNERRLLEAAQEKRGRGSSAPRYSVPASLREIPNYKALAQESKDIFGNRMGRKMEDWELAIISDELQRAYKMQNKEKIEAHRAAWEDAVSGGTVNVENIEVTNPAYEVDYYIEEKYEDELDRQERVGEFNLNRGLLMDSITTGRQMI